MNDTPTPRTDAISPRHLYTQFVPADFARQLERELASITDTASMLASDLRAYQTEFMPKLERELAAVTERIRRLEQMLAASESLISIGTCSCLDGDEVIRCRRCIEVINRYHQSKGIPT